MDCIRYARGESTSLADLDTERALVGGLLLHPQLLPGVIAAGLTPDSFAAPAHAAAFRALVRVGVNALTARPIGAVHDELARSGDLRLAGGLSALIGFLIAAIAEIDVPLLPALVPMMAERIVMLGHARQVQASLRIALDRVERDPADAHLVLREFPIPAAA